MSDALSGFAQGFAQGFTSTYTARMQNEAAEKRDKIRFGAQAWLKQEERYNAAKASDEQMMQQAEALVESQSLIPKDATIDIYNMLRGGMTSSQIISDVRTSGSKFEALPKPSESGLVVEDSAVSTELSDQTEAMLEDDNQGLSPGANSPGVSVPNANEVAGENTATAITPKEEKEDPNNPFTQYQKEIQEAVGQTDNPYFNQVLSGYTPEVRQNKYKFIPGVTKTDIPSLQDMLAASVYNSDAYKTAVADSDEEAREVARGYMASFFALQADHYEADADHWKDIEGYKQFSKTFGNLRKMADPANLDKFLDNQLIGSPSTIAGKLEEYRDLGFNHFILNCAREGWPAELRKITMQRFAKEIAPGFKN